MIKKIATTLFIAASLVGTLFADSFYQVDFTKAKPMTDAGTAGRLEYEAGHGVYYNFVYGNCWLMHANGRSYLKFTFRMDKLPGGDKKLILTHRAALGSTKHYTPLVITANDHTVVDPFELPKSKDFLVDTFDLTPYLREGENTVYVYLKKGALTNYWIRDVRIELKD